MRQKQSRKRMPAEDSAGRLVIGVFVDEHSDRPPYGEQNTLLERFAKKAGEMGLDLYAFSIPQPDVDRGKLMVRKPGHSWSLAQARLPNVVYDRALFRRRSDRLAARESLTRLRSMGIKVFNPVVGSKLAIHRYLCSRRDARRYLPETERVKDLSQVFRFLRTWKDAYLKPSVGTQGCGVLRVRRLRHRFAVSGFTNRLRHIEYSDLGENDLTRLLRSIMGSRQYLVQQAIDTITWRECRTDVRILVQRDGHGVWQVTGAAARVATDHNDVCNLHRGGRAVTLNAVLSEMKRETGAQPDTVRAELMRAAIILSRALTSRYPLLGELGLDFVIDKDGSVWFIEANPRPGRSIFRVLGMAEVAEKSVERPLEYAAHLVSAEPGGRSVVSRRIQSDR